MDRSGSGKTHHQSSYSTSGCAAQIGVLKRLQVDDLNEIASNAHQNVFLDDVQI